MRPMRLLLSMMLAFSIVCVVPAQIPLEPNLRIKDGMHRGSSTFLADLPRCGPTTTRTPRIDDPPTREGVNR